MAILTRRARRSLTEGLRSAPIVEPRSLFVCMHYPTKSRFALFLEMLLENVHDPFFRIRFLQQSFACACRRCGCGRKG
ncbi:hypothetical protein F9K80_20205 [Brucella intermedia]|nr:hypothetical protein F9K80_20205 [Brucella intermedia]